MSATCENCRFFAPSKFKTNGEGECRHRSPKAFQLIVPLPPSPLMQPGSAPEARVGYQGAWPPVSKDRWCGDHQPRIAEVAP